MLDLGNKYLNISNGIKLPSAPQSILDVILVCLWLMLDSNLVNITDFILSRLMYFTLTTLKLWSCSSYFLRLFLTSWCTSSITSLACRFPCCLQEDLQAILKWLALSHSLHFFQYAGHCLGACHVLKYMHVSLCMVSHSCF